MYRTALFILLLFLIGCSNPNEPSLRSFDGKCTIYQTPDGVVYDVCSRE